MSCISTKAFWQFSLASYPAQEKRMLKWQVELGANVNLALLCLYLDAEKWRLNPSQIINLHICVAEFSKTFTDKLRSNRTFFKAHQAEISHYSEIRRNLLEAELMLERQEQALLITQLQSSSLAPTEPGATSNLTLYLKQLPLQN